MLSSYRDDLNIAPGEFTEACQSGRKHNISQFRQGLFQQVYAAEDFTVFTAMMIQKNIELQLQALELLRANVPLGLTIFSGMEFFRCLCNQWQRPLPVPKKTRTTKNRHHHPRMQSSKMMRKPKL